jgi:DNA-binding response OmpR family regulator
MSRKILIVDDDPDLLDILSYFLTDNGFEILTLPTGEKVIENIYQFLPDLILMDIMLAGMDGREICKDIKQNPRTMMPVILISASHEIHYALQQIGAPNDFLAKPFDLDRLLEKIEVQLAA